MATKPATTNAAAPESLDVDAGTNVQAQAVEQSDELQITLDAFCARKSETVKRPELLGGFHRRESRAGHLRDLPGAFDERFAKFISTPV